MGQVGRRDRARGLRWLAVLLLLALVAGACSGGDDDDGDGGGDATGTTADGGGEVDPEGVLRVGSGLVYPAGIHLDPTKSAVNADRVWMELVFGTLLRWTASGELEAWMAEEYELVDPQTLELTLRDGVTFPDGTPYDAEAVRAGLLRTLREASDVTRASLSVAFQAITDVVVVDPSTIRISLSAPQAGELAAALADREGVIVSPGQVRTAPGDIDSRPIGAGPYTVEEFVAAQRVVLTKNPEFWDADSWRLGGLEFVHVEGQAVVNGLLGGALDLALGLPVESAERVGSDDAFTVESKPTDRSYVLLNLCTGKPPLDDIDVRRALQVGIDRKRVADLVYGGQATEALTLWPEEHVYYNPEVEDIVGYRPERARELLGGERVPLDIAYINVVPDHDAIAEVLEAQLEEIGFDITIVPTQDPVAEFITPQKPGGLLVPGSRTGVDKYTRTFAAGQVQALCGEAKPEVVEAVAPAAALVPGSEDVAEMFQEADLLVAKGAFVVPIVWSPNIAAWNHDRLGGEQEFTATLAQPIYETFFVKR